MIPLLLSHAVVVITERAEVWEDALRPWGHTSISCCSESFQIIPWPLICLSFLLLYTVRCDPDNGSFQLCLEGTRAKGFRSLSARTQVDYWLGTLSRCPPATSLGCLGARAEQGLAICQGAWLMLKDTAALLT